MQENAKTVVFSGLVLLVLSTGASFASPAGVEWTRDGWLLLAGTAALALAALHTLAVLGGRRAALRFMAVAIAIFWAAEAIGLRGVPLFGSAYLYHSDLRPLLPGGVPVFIPLAWFSLAAIPVLLMKERGTMRPDGRRDAAALLSKAAWSAWGMVACDLTLDPVAVSLGLWTWERPGAYFGVPWLNFAGWWAVSFLVFWAGYGWAFPGRTDGRRLPLRHELAWGGAHGSLLVLLGFAAYNRIGSGGPLWLSLAAISPLSAPWLNRLYGSVQAARTFASPAGRRGSIPGPEFSTVWKTVFHTMEKCFAIFPHNGKNVSTVWKNQEPRFPARAAVIAIAEEGPP